MYGQRIVNSDGCVGLIIDNMIMCGIQGWSFVGGTRRYIHGRKNNAEDTKSVGGQNHWIVSHFSYHNAHYKQKMSNKTPEDMNEKLIIP